MSFNFVPVFSGYRQIMLGRPEFDMLSGLDFVVQCPSLTRFVYENDRNSSPAVELKSVVAKFPNLTYFRIKCIQVEDLTALIHLNKLTELRVDFHEESRVDTREPSWLGLQEALTVIGTNLISLTLHDGPPPLAQSDVNFIFEACPNLEYLQIDQSLDENYSVDVPSFRKLKELILLSDTERERDWTSNTGSVLKFGVMVNLEILSILKIKMDFLSLESIMLDNVKFPKLRIVKTNALGSKNIAKIEEIARDNNIDFSIQNDGMDRYYETNEEDCIVDYSADEDGEDYSCGVYLDDYDHDVHYDEYFENSD